MKIINFIAKVTFAACIFSIAQIFVLLVNKNLEQKSTTSVSTSNPRRMHSKIYAITPTNKRLSQKADLTRLSQTLLHIRDFQWIVIEDSESKTQLVSKLLKNSGLNYIHLNLVVPKKSRGNGRKVEQRNAGLSWLRENLPKGTDGIVHFMDDASTYNIRLFEQMRTTKVASVWPVAFAGRMKYEGPVECQDGKVTKWLTWQGSTRAIPIDMGGFALRLDLVLNHKQVEFLNEGWLESDFLKKFGLTKERMEAKANDCTEILVWKTNTREPNIEIDKKTKMNFEGEFEL